MNDCGLCEVVSDGTPPIVIRDWGDVIAARPGNPLLPNINPTNPIYRDGHFLTLPREHIPEMLDDPEMAAYVTKCAAELARDLGWSDGHFAFNVGAQSGRTGIHMVGHFVYADETHRHTMPWFGQRLRSEAGDGAAYYITGENGSAQLWRGPADSPVSLGYKSTFDDIDPLMWPTFMAVLAPTPFLGR